jgi:putative redox protein
MAAPAYPIDVVWTGGRRFSGSRTGGPALVIDADRTIAPGPVDALLIALASCSSVDVVDILEKRRTPATSLHVRVEFERAASVPRRLTRVHLLFTIATASERAHVENAVRLAVEKYCSVATSLSSDIDITWELRT